MGTEKYNDIIDMPHHVSDKRPQMSMLDRAAQFAPFAALTGHDRSIKETEQKNIVRLEESEAGIPFYDDLPQYAGDDEHQGGNNNDTE